MIEGVQQRETDEEALDRLERQTLDEAKAELAAAGEDPERVGLWGKGLAEHLRAKRASGLTGCNAFLAGRTCDAELGPAQRTLWCGYCLAIEKVRSGR